MWKTFYKLLFVITCIYGTIFIIVNKKDMKTPKIMDDFIHKITCDDNSCSMRYYVDKGELAVGLLRFTHGIKEGKIPQHIVTIINMDINDMIAFIMVNYGLTQEHGEVIVSQIRNHAQRKVMEHLKIPTI